MGPTAFRGWSGLVSGWLLDREADHRYVMDRLHEQRVPVAILVFPSAQELIATFDGLRHYVHDQFTELRAVEGDGDEIAEIAFNPSLAVGRDRETGWHCDR